MPHQSGTKLVESLVLPLLCDYRDCYRDTEGGGSRSTWVDKRVYYWNQAAWHERPGEAPA